MTTSRRIRIAVSSCLLGQRVRYDGGHKRERYIVQRLARRFVLVPVCPEVAIGMGVPRPPIHLVGDPRSPRAVGVDDPSLDVTRKLERYGRRQTRALAGVSGYIFKARSPSCGLEGVKVYGRRGGVRPGRGVYARAFLARHPKLPAIEEDALRDRKRRAQFIEQVLAYDALRTRRR
jgi:uncharacterized protein YbbK (DUF523 family)